MLNMITNSFRDIALYAYWSHVFDLSGLVDYLISHKPFPIGSLVEPSFYF